MRVSSNSLPDSLVGQLNLLNSRQNRLQTQVATGQRVQWGDDDPAAMQAALDIQSAARLNTQYQKNIGFLQDRSTVTATSLRGLQDVVDRAGEIAVLADGAKSADEFQAYANEVDQLIRHAADLGNTQNRDDYIFGGTRTNKAPFVLTENDQKQVASVAYAGNSDSSELEIAPGASIAVQSAGVNTLGTGTRGVVADSRTGADLFAHLISLRDHLSSHDAASIANTDRAALRQDEDHLIYQIANTGAVQTRLDTARAQSTSRAGNLKQALSRETDADLAESMVQLNATQTAYRAALQSGANLLSTSLMDYLK